MCSMLGLNLDLSNARHESSEPFPQSPDCPDFDQIENGNGDGGNCFVKEQMGTQKCWWRGVATACNLVLKLKSKWKHPLGCLGGGSTPIQCRARSCYHNMGPRYTYPCDRA